jgi:hypothetical protein
VRPVRGQTAPNEFIEPGIWLTQTVPGETDAPAGTGVVRLATLPDGRAMLAGGKLGGG